MAKRLLWLGKAYLIVVFPFVLVLAAARIVMSPLFLQIEYNLPGFPPDPFGFTQQDRLNYAPYAVNYLLNGEGIDYLADLKFPDGTLLYQADELRHMRDVKALTQIAFGAAFVAGLIALADAYYLSRRKSLSRPLMYGAMVTLAIVAAIIVGALVDWDGFFVGFHELFFQNGTWYFPTNDTLIRLFPEQFWFDAALSIGGITVLTCVIVLAVTWRVSLTARHGGGNLDR